ncbi:nucleotidyltransferase family protein [Sphingopyxis sp.]|uniref:nucleotidyltransferase family protein n=1 Tax=Sphingopyxis sp. TaxID=1908224 RepID=UPI003D12D47D
MDHVLAIQDLLAADPRRSEALSAVADLSLPDAWIGAGFIRDAVWDHLHGHSFAPPAGDVDVVWFAPDMPLESADRDIEDRLRSMLPQFTWSVKNQARMYSRNGDMPYTSVVDAMMHWPETATAVAARYDGRKIEVSAPFGLDDLFALRLRPTAAFVERKLSIFQERLRSKRWLERYPMLTLVDR